MAENIYEEAAVKAAPAGSSPSRIPGGDPPGFQGDPLSSPERVRQLQRTIGNSATTRLLLRSPPKTAKQPTASSPRPAADTSANAFTPLVPHVSVDACFQAGVNQLHETGWPHDAHIAVIAGSVYVAESSGRRVGNFALKGSFGLVPGIYWIDGSGSRRFGYRGNQIVTQPIGWLVKDLSPEMQEIVKKREEEQKAKGKKGPTIYLTDFIEMSDEQSEAEFSPVMIFVLEPTKSDSPDQGGDKGSPTGGDQGGGKTVDGQQIDQGSKEEKPPALADTHGYGSESGAAGGDRADLPRFPSEIRPMSSLRGGVVKRAEGDDGAALPFVFQPVRGAATYVMEIDYTMASPGFLLGQASAAARPHVYKWEVWDITQSHDDAIAKAADEAARKTAGAGSRKIRATDAAKEDLGRATEELSQRDQQYKADEQKAFAERRYFDGLAGEVNQKLEGVEVLFRYGKELIGLGSDAADTGRERRVPIPTEGVFLLRCVAHYDPEAKREHRPTRAPSVATMIIKVKPSEWLSRDALSEAEANIDDLGLTIATLQASIKQAKEAGRDTAEMEAELARDIAQRDMLIQRSRDLPVSMLEKELESKRKALADAQKTSGLYASGYGDMDDNLRALNNQVDTLDKQLSHVRDQVKSLQGGNAARMIHRVSGVLVSRVTGQTYPLLLQVSDPVVDASGEWTCRLADSTSRSGKYYDGHGGSAVAAMKMAIEGLAGDNVEGYGDGNLSVRVPAAGQFAGLDEKTRTFQMETRPRDWAAARERLDELATILGILAVAVVPGAGEAAMALGAVLAAARILERLHNDTLFWDASLVSDILAIAMAAAAGTAAIGKLRVVKSGDKFVIVAAEEGSRMERLSKLATHVNDWFLDPASIAWGNTQMLIELKNISDQEISGAMTATEARRARAGLMATALNTTLNLAGKVTGAVHEGDKAFEKTPKGGGRREEGQQKNEQHEQKPPEQKPPEQKPPEQKPPEQKPPEQKPPEQKPPEQKPPEQKPAGTGDQVVVPGAGQPPAKPAVVEVPPRPAFQSALAAGGALPVAEAGRVVLDVRDWKGALREYVKGLPAEHQSRAMEALAEARSRLVREITDEAAKQFGADQRNYGTPGFGSDIDLTITPKELLPGHTGTERPVADQIRAAADAGEFINRKLRERLGGEPDHVIDTNVYSYIAEDRVVLGTPELRARAGALEAEIGLAEARRGIDQQTWDALRQKIADQLSGSDAISKRALADLTARMDKAAATEKGLRAEVERVRSLLLDKGVPAGEVAVQARDAILADKKRRLADLFEAPKPDMIEILRLQAEIRWIAPDAYAGGAAFDYAVGFGQARRSAGDDAAAKAGRDSPSQADVLADLAANWDREKSRPEDLRRALYSAAATSQLGMLGAHTHGKTNDQVKASAKYAARILDLIGYAGLGADGPVPKALANFVRGRHPDAPESVKTQMLVQYAMDVGMWGGIIRNEAGKPTDVSDAVKERFIREAQLWALDATAKLMVTERTHPDAAQDAARTAPPPASPESPASPTSPPDGGAGGLRGSTYELTNTKNVPGPAGTTHEIGGLELKHGAQKVSRALDGISGLDGGATIKAVAKDSLNFELTIPDPANPAAPKSVPVDVVIKKTTDLTASVHGSEGGPARLIPTATTDSTGARVWRARIEVDSRLTERDLPHVLRHEANELTGLISSNAKADPDGTFASQMSAAVMRPGGPEGSSPTAHDRAAVLELKGLYDNLAQQKPGTKNFDARQDSIDRAIASMGLDDASNLFAKMKMLRDEGLPKDLINRLVDAVGRDVAATHRAQEAAAGRTTIFSDFLAGKTSVPRDLGEFKAKGLNGGHVTQQLLSFCAISEFHVREVGTPKTVDGTVWRRFEQWKWLGPVADKPATAAELPGGAGFDPSKWTKSDQPKTTADDVQIFLREANLAWQWWLARHDGGPTAQDDSAVSGRARAFGGPSGQENARSPGGVEFAGFFESGSGKPEVSTIFVDGSWLP